MGAVVVPGLTRRLTARELAQGETEVVDFMGYEVLVLKKGVALPKSWRGYRVQRWVVGHLMLNANHEHLDDARAHFDELVRARAVGLASQVLAA